MVAPVDDELQRIERIGTDEYRVRTLSHVSFAPLLPLPLTVLPIPLLNKHPWSLPGHMYFPRIYRLSVHQLLLCQRHSHSRRCLPKDILLAVLTFTHRDWFLPDYQEESQTEAGPIPAVINKTSPLGYLSQLLGMDERDTASESEEEFSDTDTEDEELDLDSISVEGLLFLV